MLWAALSAAVRASAMAILASPVGPLPSTVRSANAWAACEQETRSQIGTQIVHMGEKRTAAETVAVQALIAWNSVAAVVT